MRLDRMLKIFPRKIDSGIMNSGSSNMEPFLEQIQSATEEMDRLSRLLWNLTVTKEQLKSVTNASSTEAIRKRMEKSVSEVRKIAGSIKLKLEAIKKGNLDSRKKPGCEEGSTTDRIRANLTHCSTKRFNGLMTEFQMLRHTIEVECGELVERRVTTGIDGNNPDDEGVINSEEGFEDRDDILTQIQKELLALHQIYQDMAVLVEAQGDWVLDHIESQVNRIREYVGEVVDVGHTLHSSARKPRKRLVGKAWSSFSRPFRCFQLPHND